jgi:hypothetical protein
VQINPQQKSLNNHLQVDIPLQFNTAEIISESTQFSHDFEVFAIVKESKEIPGHFKSMMMMIRGSSIPGSNKWKQFDDEAVQELDKKDIDNQNDFTVSQLIYIKVNSEVHKQMMHVIEVPVRVERDFAIYTYPYKH